MKIHAMDLPPVSDRDYDFAPSADTPAVVLGYDGTRASHAALERARELAGSRGRLVVVRAYSGAPPADPFEGLEGDGFEARVVEAEPAEALADAAMDCRAEHIVIGWAESDPGRVCTALLERGSGPVTVVPAGIPADS